MPDAKESTAIASCARSRSAKPAPRRCNRKLQAIAPDDPSHGPACVSRGAHGCLQPHFDQFFAIKLLQNFFGERRAADCRRSATAAVVGSGSIATCLSARSQRKPSPTPRSASLFRNRRAHRFNFSARKYGCLRHESYPMLCRTHSCRLRRLSSSTRSYGRRDCLSYLPPQRCA